MHTTLCTQYPYSTFPLLKEPCLKGQDAGDQPALQKSQTVEPEATGSQPDRQFSGIWQGLGVSTIRGGHEEPSSGKCFMGH